MSKKVAVSILIVLMLACSYALSQIHHPRTYIAIFLMIIVGAIFAKKIIYSNDTQDESE